MEIKNICVFCSSSNVVSDDCKDWYFVTRNVSVEWNILVIICQLKLLVSGIKIISAFNFGAKT